jgi:hypothetical protein
VMSELGNGSTFMVVLPARRVARDPLPDRAPGPVSSTTSN